MRELYGCLCAIRVNDVSNLAKILQNVVLEAHLIVEGSTAGFYRAIGHGTQANATPGETFVKRSKSFAVGSTAAAMTLERCRFDEPVAHLEPAQGPWAEGIRWIHGLPVR
jgi:hypothetical protein